MGKSGTWIAQCVIFKDTLKGREGDLEITFLLLLFINGNIYMCSHIQAMSAFVCIYCNLYLFIHGAKPPERQV